MTMQGLKLGMMAVGAALLLASCGGGEPPVEKAPVARPVKMMVIGEGAAAGPRSLPGRVEASNQVNLSFRVGGPLTALSVKEGDEVRKGQVLARVDPRDYQIAMRSATAQHEKTQADFKRTAALYEKEAVSQAQLEQARAARDVARAAKDNASADLNDTSLRAPFSALVGETYVENFQDVQPKEPILSLVDVASVKIVVDIPESLLAAARNVNPERIYARFEAAPDEEFEVELLEMAAQADSRTQTFRATLVMPQPEGLNVLPGMTATVSARDPAVPTAEGTVTVPGVALFSDESGQPHVWVVDTGAMTVLKRAVRTGRPSGTDSLEVLEGLEPGETIAVSGASRLHEGQPVRRME